MNESIVFQVTRTTTAALLPKKETGLQNQGNMQPAWLLVTTGEGDMLPAPNSEAVEL